MSHTIRQITDDAEWDELVDRAELGTVYHRSGWLSVLNECTEARIHRVALEGPTGLLAIWPIGLLRKGPIRIGGSPLPGWNTAYLGPLFTTDCVDKLDAVRTMHAAPPIKKPAFLAMRIMDTTLDLEPLGFHRSNEFETYEVDLTASAEDRWARLKSTCRTQIRKGEKNGLEIREEDNNAYLDDFMEMAADVFAKTNKNPPFTKTFLEQIDRRLRTQSQLLVTSAFFANERIATLIIPHDRHVAMYFAGVSRASRLDLAPNNLLHWRTMALCRELGLTRYDFISNKGSPGRFKATFHPTERVSCIHWERSANRLVHTMRSVHEKKSRRSRRLNQKKR